MIRFLVPIFAALALAGCSGSLADVNPPTEVKIVSDTYCTVAKKRSWDVTDTQQSIDEARSENHKWDCLCTNMRGTPACKAYTPAASS